MIMTEFMNKVSGNNNIYKSLHSVSKYARQNEKPHRINCKGIGNIRSFYVTEDQLQRIEKWIKTGEHIQNILPDLTSEEREILLSGNNNADWEELFGESIAS